MHTKNLLQLTVGMLIIASSGLMTGCSHHSVYDPDRGKEPLPAPSEVFGFETRGDIDLYVNYDSPGIQALIEIYDENPLASENSVRDKKEGVEALFKIYTDENGKFEGKMNIPTATGTVYLYTGTWGLPGCVKLEIKNGAVHYDLSPQKAPESKAMTRAYGFSGKVPYLIDKDRSLYSICKWKGLGTLSENEGYITSTSKVGEEAIGVFTERLKDFFLSGKDNSKYTRGPETTNLSVKKNAEVDIIFINRDAHFDNTFGYYYYKTNSNVDVAKAKKYIVFPNVYVTNDYSSDPTPVLKCGDKVRLKFFGENGDQAASDNFPAGYTIGWFIYAAGYNNTDYEHFGEIRKEATLITTNDAKSSYVTISDKKSNKLIIGVEDGGNKSYCDLLFYTEATPMEAIEDPNRPDIPDPDKPIITPDAVETTSGTLAFEDIWPSGGDYDMNDVVVEYQRQVFFNKDNTVTKIEDTFTAVHDGAVFANAFAYQLYPGQLGEVSSKDNIQTEQATSSIIVFDNAKKSVGNTCSIIRTFNSGKSLYKGNLQPYNPYIIVKYTPGQANRTEVHLPKHDPTDMVDPSLIGQKDDLYYVDRSRKYPFAIDIPIRNFTVVTERAPIDSEYPDFAKWAESKGEKYKDWYNKKQ